MIFIPLSNNKPYIITINITLVEREENDVFTKLSQHHLAVK